MSCKRISVAAGLKSSGTQGATQKARRVGDEPLIACARHWGSADWVFEGWDIQPRLVCVFKESLIRRWILTLNKYKSLHFTDCVNKIFLQMCFPVASAICAGADTSTELWQVQLAGPNARCFSFKIMAVMREAVLEHPNVKVRTAQDVESVLGLRVVLGTPAPVGPSDPDGVGFVDWQLVIYSCGLPVVLDFIHFILDYKVRKEIEIASLPLLAVHVIGSAGSPPPSLSSPWFYLKDTRIEIPKPFSALPPKGRRHLLMQLDVLDKKGDNKEEDKGTLEMEQVESVGEEKDQSQPDPTYAITFFGNIFPFKDRFDEQGIPVTLTVTNAVGQKSYTRYLEVSMDAPSKQKVLGVLEGVLKGLPLYFINMADKNDPMAAWVLQQPSIVQSESAGGP